MTLSTQTSRIEYTANGSQATFNYSFEIFQTSDMKVYKDGVLQTSGYSVTGVGNDNGGTVVFSTPPASGVVVRLARVTAKVQELVLREFQKIPVAAVEKNFDKIVAMIQELAQSDSDINVELDGLQIQLDDLLAFLQSIALQPSAQYVGETQPEFGFQGMRWYNPSAPATYVFYYDGDSGQWVQEAHEGVDGALRSDLASSTSAVPIAGVPASDLGQSFMRRKVFAPLLASNTAAQNSAILQAKIDYARSLLDAGFYGGVLIELPQGQFDFAGAQVKRGVYGITGAGMTQTVLNVVGANVVGLYCQASISGLSADQVDFGCFSGFTIQPKTPNITAPVNQVMWDVIGFSRWRVEDVYFGWCGGATAIRATNGALAGSGGPAQWHNTFVNCYVNRAASWPAGGIGWLLGDTSMSKEQITTWSILGGRTSGSGGGTGLNVQSANTLVFYLHAIEGCDINIGNHGGARIAENVCFIPAYFEGANTCTVGSKASNTNFIGEFLTGYTVNDTSGTLNRISPTNFQTRCGNSGTEDWIVNILSAINRRPKFKGTAVSGIDLISNSGTVSVMNTQNIGASFDQFAVYSGTALNTRLFGFGDSGLTMLTDGFGSVGSAANRCGVVFSSTGTINTSDEREKTELLELDVNEKAAAIELKCSIRKFKFKDAVSLKGEKARIHFGVGAQTVKDIMEKHGLDPFAYGVLCYDEWEEVVEETEDDTGNLVKQVLQQKGNRYGIRYDELSMFILAGI